ncbi:MAG: PAS/PAC sensor hybrid histidine [Methylocystaceae bacterium]|nr:MAG: PAS/PAC sensor hybrid histidine [Methylocystaceae bacterium]
MRAPLSPADAVQLNEFPVTTPSARRVLVIDDDRDVADSMAMLLDVLGCDVRTAYSGAVGISLVSAFQPKIVFLDLGMPEMNGYEAARRIRSAPAGQQAQLIALSGWREAGFDRHLVKPADIDILEEILAACGDESQQI